MKGEVKERWLRLCEQAVVEQDTQKLMVLVEEINRLLDEKEERLHKKQVRLEKDGAEGQH